MRREVRVSLVADATQAMANVPQPLHLPLPVESGKAGLAGEELLHGGLLEVALLGDEPFQAVQQCIHIAQCGCDGALFGERRTRDRNADELFARKVVCDSMYSINCVSKWAVGWEKKGWRKAGGEIKNLEIIQATYLLYCRIESRVQLTHVSAHAGTEGNELADRMAMLAVQSRTQDLCRYREEIDVQTLLRMRAG